ncbi:MAG: DEAD/DEAH box helicase [Armatimonadota bacterium]|nr:DEAD/DEAH box helicase [Armatimonadota bacterium]MDR7469336.1 DEAD/DEAH box helicase [Armatimonadota bacterium]MDR7539250.1 DEAD/DEAH box helicase [Armatimonadota bacterium]
MMRSTLLGLPFHPLVAGWFTDRFGGPTAPQRAGWREIASGRHTLIAAPTGSGKTLAAFLWAINRLVEQGLAGALPDRTQVVYVSPLKALGNDIEKNLQEPLRGIRQRATSAGLALPELRIAVRSGDTPARERERMRRRPPHVLITTPESLFILLTAAGSRAFLRTAETVIVDEIHAVAGDKRGAHLALSLERLDALAGHPLQRIGLSATQKPIGEIAALLVGAANLRPDGTVDCAVVDVGHRRPLDLAIEVPDQPLGPITTNELWQEVYDRIAAQVRAHRTTLVFVHTRRQVERVAHQLSGRLGREKVAAHHGSLSRETRLGTEQRLKAAEVPVVVATASLELGIDIGHVDLVCHVGAPRLLSTLLQRVGRSGHGLEATPKGILYPLTRDELVQCAAAVRAVRAGELDRVTIPHKPLDILAQQVVAIAASGEMAEEDLWGLVRRAAPYRDLTRGEFEAVLQMLAEGMATGRGRRSAYLHRDRVHGVVRARRGAGIAAITSGGAIPDVADYDVVEEPSGALLGKVNEEFAQEAMGGDVFLLGNRAWRIKRVERGRVRVEDAHGAKPTIPFWIGEAPARSAELSRAVAELRAEVETRLLDPQAAVAWLQVETGVSRAGAEQIVAYLAETAQVLGAVPTQRIVIAERFFDEAGGMQLVLHLPFGGRITRAWGFALRKRFCLTFDFELQAAATDDGIVLSLGEQHAFPLDSIWSFVHPATLEDDLVQAVLPSPLFANRWRWNASRALAVLRFERGRRVPMPLQRMRADDLLAAVFPAQVACQDNHAGPIVPPDHPLVRETIRNCLQEAMDVDGLRAVLQAIERGEIRTLSVETAAPSLMSHEILHANPYAFLDDAPLEERRARAVALRRTAPDLASGWGALDPEAIALVRAQAWPDVRDADELHDLLLSLGLLPLPDAAAWEAWSDALRTAGRAALASWEGPDGLRRGLVAAERLPLVRALLGPVTLDPPVTDPPGVRAFTEEEAAEAVVQGWLEILGPVTAHALASRLGLPGSVVQRALAGLEGRGVALRGRFTPEAAPDQVEWCERHLLARIHRLTLGRLRREIEPVTTADFVRFLLRWQHLAPGTQLHGREGLVAVIGQLQGLELPAPAWEQWVLPGRVARYDPADLEGLCLSGVVAWGRLARREPPDNGEGEDHRPRRAWQAPSRQAPLALLLREDLPYLLPVRPRWSETEGLSQEARDVAAYLEQRGASFLTDIARGTGYVPAAVEDALWELVARGLVTGDGIAGLRVLLQPEVKRRGLRRRLRVLRGGRIPPRLMPVGRWSLWGGEDEVPPSAARTEFVARQLLRRYGVVFRDLLARESAVPPWRALLEVYRRLEARGEVRAGRFVGAFLGEQFSLPEAVDALRTIRRQSPSAELVLVSSADPLNLVGILLPGGRVSAFANQFIAYRDGVPVEVGSLGALRSRLQSLQVTEGR